MTLGIVLGMLRRGVSAVLHAVDRFIDAEGYRLAASLSFYALGSLLPLLLLAVGVADMLLGDSSELRQSLVTLLDVTDSEALRELIVNSLEGVKGSGPRSAWGIAIGFLGAAFGASGIFLELDTAMEKLFRVPPVRRSPLQHIKRFLIDRGAALLLVMGTCLLLLFGVFVLSSLELLATKLRVPADRWPGALTYLGTVGLLLAALTLCFRVIPQPRVRFRAALGGASFATLGLTLTRVPLAWGITHLTSYATYGVIGALLVLVTWFYVAGNILLLGAALTAQLSPSSRYAATEDQGNHGQNQEHDEQDLGNTGGAGGNATKTKDGGQQSDDEKNGGPVQHDDSSNSRSLARAED